MKITAIIAAALLAAGITTGTTSQPDIIPAAQLPAEPQMYTVTGTFNYYCKDIRNGGYYVRFEPDNVNLYEYYVDKPQDACNPKLGAHYEVTITQANSVSASAQEAAKKARTSLRMIIPS